MSATNGSSSSGFMQVQAPEMEENNNFALNSSRAFSKDTKPVEFIF